MPRTLHLLGLGEKLATSAAHLPDGDFGPWAEIEKWADERGGLRYRQRHTGLRWSGRTPAAVDRLRCATARSGGRRSRLQARHQEPSLGPPAVDQLLGGEARPGP